MEAVEKKVGEYVKRVRESAKMSQTEFAKFLGVKQSFLSAVERGVRKPPKSWGIVLNKEFGVSENYLELGVITKEVVPMNGTNEGTNAQKMGKSGTTRKKLKKGPNSPVEADNDHLFGQGQPAPVRTPEEEEKLAQVRDVMQRHPGMPAEAFVELHRIRQNPDYARTAKKLHELRERLKFDLQKNEPELLELTQAAELTSHLINDLQMVQMRYFGAFAEAQQNFAVAGQPLSQKPIEEVQYSEYREAMIKVAKTLQPFAELISIYNTKMQEILNESAPADSDHIIQGFLL